MRGAETDRWLFVATIALCLGGAVMVFSASALTAREQYGNSYHFLLRQLLWLGLGLIAMFAMLNLDYRRLRQPKFVLTYFFMVLTMLVGVFALDKSHATHRWFRVGPASLQPSELAKLAVILYLAWFLELRSRPRSFGVNDVLHTLAPALGLVLMMAGLVVMEPDLGTSLEILIIAMAMLFVAGLSWKYIGTAVAVAIPAIYFAVVHVSYRYERVMAFLHPDADPAGPRIPTDAIADRRRLGRIDRRGPDGEHARSFSIFPRRTRILSTRFCARSWDLLAAPSFWRFSPSMPGAAWQPACALPTTLAAFWRWESR